MIRAAVFIFSYGQDETADFQDLAAPSEYRDPELERWLKNEVFDRFQKREWSEGQTVYFFAPFTTSTSEYTVACRVVSRLTQARRRDYRELVAVYADRGALLAEASPEDHFSNVPWDTLVAQRPGFVDISAKSPSGTDFTRSLTQQVEQLISKRGVAVCERNWRNLCEPTTLYWAVRGAGSAVRSKSRVITGARASWKLFNDFEVQVLGADHDTPFDHNSPAFQAHSLRQQSLLLLEHVPNSYLELRSLQFTVNWMWQVLEEARQRHVKDPAFLVAMLASLEKRIHLVHLNFKHELDATRARDHGASSTLNTVEPSWEMLRSKLIQELRSAQAQAESLPTVRVLTGDDVWTIARQAAEEMRQSVAVTVAQNRPAPTPQTAAATGQAASSQMVSFSSQDVQSQRAGSWFPRFRGGWKAWAVLTGFLATIAALIWCLVVLYEKSIEVNKGEKGGAQSSGKATGEPQKSEEKKTGEGDQKPPKDAAGNKTKPPAQKDGKQKLSTAAENDESKTPESPETP